MIVNMDKTSAKDSPKEASSNQLEPKANGEANSSNSTSLKELDIALIQAAHDWSQYLQIEATPTNTDVALQDLSEDLVMRLNEFDHLLAMSQDETGHCLFRQMPLIQEKFKEMEKVFQKIDRLELMVNRVRSDVDNVDRQLLEAEATVESTASSSSVQSLVPSFIGGAKTLIESSAASVLNRATASNVDSSISLSSRRTFNDNHSSSNGSFEPIQIFSTKDFFPD